MPVADRRAADDEAAASGARELAAIASAVLAQLVEREPEGISVATLSRVLEVPRASVEVVVGKLSATELLCRDGSVVALGRGIDEIADHSRGWPEGWFDGD